MLRTLFCTVALALAASGADVRTASDIAAALQQARLDPEQTYRVRELQLSRGDIKLYLTDGLLSFVTPVAGRTFGAVFTTYGIDTGDAEVLVMPPPRSERVSLASFTNSPNLDEHFHSVLLLFSDDSAAELLSQIQSRPVRKAAELGAQLAPKLNPGVQEVISEVIVRLVGSLLDNHKRADGFFYSLIVGQRLGNFDVLYDPLEFEPVSIGRLAAAGEGQPGFQLWTSFRPRQAAHFATPAIRIAEYSIDTTIRPDLSLRAAARFQYTPDSSEGRVLTFALSEKLTVVSAAIDENPVEVFQSQAPAEPGMKTSRIFLVVSAAPTAPGRQHRIDIRYEGSVIRQTGDGSYFVDERNAWYPISGTIFTNFDLTFHCPEHLRLVSTGELVSDEVADGVRVVHRRTQSPEHLAGFNLGEYELVAEMQGLYRVECFSNKASPRQDPHLVAKQTEGILDDYTRRWMQLPIHSVAVSPVPAYFGQGFPGLIYLSMISYLRPEDRPPQLRNPRLDTFFSEMLLPHEIAHQWWGNLVSAADYRTAWVMEAMANYSALQLLEREKGAAALEAVLAQYQQDLLSTDKGKTMESAGPVDFGSRLLDNSGLTAWHVILYEKGTWILHMLRQRLGDAAFNRMQVRLLEKFTAKPLTNEDFRDLLSEFVPDGQPDKDLSDFFDAWVYGMGIPNMALHGSDLEISGVDDAFSADVPLRCHSKTAKEQIRWVRATSGANPLDPSYGACDLPSASSFLYAR